MAKEKKKVPNLRFKGFTDDWEQRRLGEVTSHRGGTAIEKYFDENGEYKVISIGSYGLDSKYVDQNIRAKSNEVTNERVVHAGELTMVLNDKTANGTIIGRSLLIENDNEYVINQRTEIIKPKESFNAKFAYTLLNGPFRNKVKRIVQGGTQIYVNYSSVEKLTVPLPNMKEQQKIGSFFNQLDSLIALHQRKLDLLNQLKNGFLQKMFADKGSKRPILRFSGFTEDWKQCKLGKLARIDTGKLNANAMVMDGKYDFYTSGKEKYKIDKYAFVGPAITVAGNGATVGYMHYADNKFNAYQRTYVLTNLKGDRRFLFNTIQANLPHKIYQESRTGNIPYIVLDMLTDLSIMIPLKEEQASIGNFVNVMDNFITAQENRLNSSKLTKKFLLQKLFI